MAASAERIQLDLVETAGPPVSSELGEALLQDLATLIADPDPNRPQYDRESFEEGGDLDGDCVRTRHEILQAEATVFVMEANGCSVAQGEWWDPYSGRWFTDPRDLEVDHVVSLGDAWRSGAWAFTSAEKEAFANQVANLNAIYGPENQTKADLGPSDYSPANPNQRCSYLAQYAAVKIAWGLTIDRSDYTAVATGLADCASTAPAIPDTAIESSAPGSTAAVTSGIDATTTSSQPATTSQPRPTATSTTMAPSTSSSCHPAYIECLPNLPGDALNCGQIGGSLKPVHLRDPTVDPYNLDGRGQSVDDGIGCEAG